MGDLVPHPFGHPRQFALLAGQQILRELLKIVELQLPIISNGYVALSVYSWPLGRDPRC